MPLTKTTTMYRRPYRRYYKKRAYGKPSKNFSRKVKRVLTKAAEKKFHDVSQAGSVSVTSTPVLVDLSSISAGDTDQTRDGDQLTIRSIHLKYQLVAGDSTNIVRIILFQWFMDTAVAGGGPTAANILQSTTNSMSSYTHDTRFQYKILDDKIVSLDTSSRDSYTLNRRIIKGFKKKIQFSAAGTSGTNKIYLLYMSDSAAAPDPGLIYYSRLTFSDV